MIPWCTAMLVVVCFGGDVGAQEHKHPDFPVETGRDLFSDSHELHPGSTHYFPELLPVFYSPWAPSYNPTGTKDADYENKNTLEVQKRISRLVVDPHSKRWSEVFRVSPKVFRELRNSGQRLRPYFRKNLVDGSFKMSYGAARKRPYYYTEPEGSEFLGGPGK